MRPGKRAGILRTLARAKEAIELAETLVKYAELPPWTVECGDGPVLLQGKPISFEEAQALNERLNNAFARKGIR